jgi:hypothetical protein
MIKANYEASNSPFASVQRYAFSRGLVHGIYALRSILPRHSWSSLPVLYSG